MKRPPKPERRPQFYGLTDAEFADLERRAAGFCELCGTKDKKLHIDHSHDSGFVRGFLCSGCNGMLGFVERMETEIRAYRKRAEAWLERMAFHKHTNRVVKRGVAFRRTGNA